MTGVDTAVDWAHLNDCRWLTDFENIVPLASDINAAMARNPGASLPGRLQSDFLRWRIFENNRLGQYSRAYACSMLASHLALSRASNPNAAIEFLASSVNALRNLDEPDLASIAIERIGLPVAKTISLRTQVSNLNWSRLAEEAAVFLREQGDRNEFVKAFGVSTKLLDREQKTTEALIHDTQLRRQWAFYLIDRGDPAGQHALDDLCAEGNTSLVRSPSPGDYLWKTFAALRKCGADAAADHLKKVEDVLGSVEPIKRSCANRVSRTPYTIWTFGAYLQLKGDIYLATGDLQAAMAFAAGAYHIYLETGARPPASGTSMSMKKYHETYHPSEAIGVGLTARPTSLRRTTQMLLRSFEQAS